MARRSSVPEGSLALRSAGQPSLPNSSSQPLPHERGSGHDLRKGDSHVPDTSATRALAHAPRTSKRPFHLNSERAAHLSGCAAHFVFSHLGRERPNNMIPDDTFNFNHDGAFSNFDDHEARLRHLLRQGASQNAPRRGPPPPDYARRKTGSYGPPRVCLWPTSRRHTNRAGGPRSDVE